MYKQIIPANATSALILYKNNIQLRIVNVMDQGVKALILYKNNIQHDYCCLSELINNKR